jgi:hypothetical protein
MEHEEACMLCLRDREIERLRDLTERAAGILAGAPTSEDPRNWLASLAEYQTEYYNQADYLISKNVKIGGDFAG